MYSAHIDGVVPDRIIWGKDAAEQVGTTITLSRAAPPSCTSPPTVTLATAAPTAPTGGELARVAIVAPDPGAPGLDGQCTAGEVISDAEAAAFKYDHASEIMHEQIEWLRVLEHAPALKDHLHAKIDIGRWSSKFAPKAIPIEPAVLGHKMQTRVFDGARPTLKAKDRRYNIEQSEAIKKQTKQWLDQGVFIEVKDDSVSITSAPLIVPKYDDLRNKNGLRMCGDYRSVNKFVVPDIKPPPRIEDMLQLASVGTWRSKLDCAGWYNQFEIDEMSQVMYTLQVDRSTIVRPLRMQFGMKNAGSVAQRAGEAIFGVLPNTCVYSDEIVRTHSGTLEEAVFELGELLEQAARHNVVLNADKAVLLSEWITLMGHEVGEDRVRALPGRLQLLLEWPAPTNIKQTVSFLAAVNHYRVFIPSFAVRAGELRAAAIHGKTFRWGEDAQAAFVALRAAMAAAATLKRIRKGEPFYVTTDACVDGIAFAVGQRDEDGVLRMVSAGGRSTASYERNYSPMDLEGVAVLAAVHRAPELLDRADVTILTDSRPLCDFFNNAPQILDPARAPVRARLAAGLQGFDFKWQHVSSEHNQIMDAASRAAWTPTSGLMPSSPSTVAHTLLPPPELTTIDASRVAIITPVDTEARATTPPIADNAGSDDDEAADTDDQSEAAESALRAQESTLATAPPREVLADSPWQTPARIKDYDESMEGGVAPPAALSSDDVADASSELISQADGGRGVDDDASTIEESAVAEGPANLPPAFGVAPMLGSDSDLEEMYSQDRLAWAAEQRADPALKRFFSHAHGIRQKNHNITRREPSIAADGRLWVVVGAARARRLVVPASQVPQLIGAEHNRTGHRGHEALCKELQQSYWWPGMAKAIEEWCARCPICQTRLKAPRETPDLKDFPTAARFAAVHIDVMPMPTSNAGNTCALVIFDRTTGALRTPAMKTKSTADIVKAYQREWVDVFGPAETLHPDDALEFHSKALRSMCRRHGTRLVDPAPYNKQANGLAERAVQTIKRALLANLHGRDVGTWDEELPRVVATYMTTAQRVRGGVSPYELTYGQAPVSQLALTHQAIAPRPTFTVSDGAQLAQAVEQRVAELVPLAQAARAKAAEKPLAAAQAAPSFAVGDEVWVENTDQAAESTAFANRQKRFGPYIVHVDDATRARVQLRVMATGRVVTDRRSGSVGQPVWFAKRRLTKTLGDVKQPHGAWLGLHDRNALPTAERIAQAQLDKKESQFRVALERRPAHVVPGSKWTAAVDIGDGRIVDIVALRNSTDGPIATVVLSNGRAVEVGGSRYERITKLARHLSPDVQRARAHHAPDWIV
jgi:hypothetical protein